MMKVHLFRLQEKKKKKTSGNYFVSLADIKTWSAGKRIRKSKKAS